MKLTDLNPRFVGAGGEGVTNADGSAIPKRHGVGLSFDCPCGGCKSRCYIPFDNPIDGGVEYGGGHPTWMRTGDTFENITLTPSILRKGGCKWHGYVTNGEIRKA